MSITDAERHDLYKALEEVLGEQRANVLMEHLPPVGWADVVTNRDLDHLEEHLRLEMLGLRKDLELQIVNLRNEVTGQLMRHTVALVGILGTLMALFNAFG